MRASCSASDNASSKRSGLFLAQLPVNSSREGTTPVEGSLSSGILLQCFLARAHGPVLKPNPSWIEQLMGFPVHGLNGQ